MGATWQVPGYDVDGCVAASGGSELWRGRDLRNGEVVALRRLRAGDGVVRERLRREAAVLSSVAGEHVVRVRDAVVADGDLVVVMDHASGGDLARLLASRDGLRAPEVVTLVGPLATALADAHERELAHGDVTPENIRFAADGRPLLAEFGVAHATGAAPSRVESTRRYLAPEVVEGAPPAPAADVYALCAIATEALGSNSSPPALRDAIGGGLADDPDRRPTARQLSLDVLRSCAAAPIRLGHVAERRPTGVTPSHRPATVSPVPVEPLERSPSVPSVPMSKRALVAAAAALALALAAGVGWAEHPRPAAAMLPPPRPAATQPPPRPTWQSVVAALDHRRARAFATDDAMLLSRVYAPHAVALTRDLATLHALARHHLTARGFTITAVDVRVVRSTTHDVVLRVTDVMTGYDVLGRGGRVVRSVAARPARTWTMTLVQVGDEWRIADISR